MKKAKVKNQEPNTVFAKKSFGQNFLIDQNYITKIISALDPQPDEIIVEIGAGRGALTEVLLESGANVLAIELDKDLIPVLEEKFGKFENFTLIEEDALNLDFHELTANERQEATVKLVANLPYYISTAILQKLTGQREVFSEMILMFQREVVERITAEPGNKERGFLTVLCEAFFDADKLFDVPPNAFRPVPKVWSAVVKFIPKITNRMIGDEECFKELIGIAFRQKRKTLLNNLKNAADIMYKNSASKDEIAALLKNAEIDPNRRAETLSLEEWIKLDNLFERENE